MTQRFEKQINFLMEIDKAKQIFRRTRLFDHSRYENDAEHAWHMCMMALILSEHANARDINTAKVVKMALIHDIVEIDAGDTFLYADNREEKSATETKAANRLFGLLPDDQRDEFIALWEEFEEKETPEAKFAGSLDRLGPIMQNHFDNGHAWQKHHVTAGKVLAKTEQIKSGSDAIWEYAKSLIESSIEKGELKLS